MYIYIYSIYVYTVITGNMDESSDHIRMILIMNSPIGAFDNFQPTRYKLVPQFGITKLMNITSIENYGWLGWYIFTSIHFIKNQQT